MYICITFTLKLHYMSRISATFKDSIEGIAKAYAEFNGISFSESVETLTGLSGTEWFNKLPKATKIANLLII